MFERHAIPQLTAYHHNELPSEEQNRVRDHLESCAKCRAVYEEIRFAARLASTLSAAQAPESLWEDMNRHASSGGAVARPRLSRLVWGTAVGLAILSGVILWSRGPRGPSWEVTGLPGKAQLRPGEALQTNATSSAQVKIADIGQLRIEPNSTIRLLVTQSNEHRIALDRGRLEASTWAPPRLFIVETPLANAVDLGCRYSLEVQEDGSSLLHVTLGLVALEREGRETIVPAGAFCRTRKQSGPGTPYFEDASAAFQAALADQDVLPAGPERMRSLEILLREARIRDALSLWHLLPRLDAPSRALIYDRLKQLLPPPDSVTREGIVNLNPAMLDAWKQVVSQLWQ